MKGIHVYLNKGPHPFSLGDNSEKTKLRWKSSSSEPIKFGIEHPWVKVTQDFTKKVHLNMKMEMIGFLLSKSTL